MSDDESGPLERTSRALGEAPSIKFYHFIIIVLLTVAVPFVALNFSGVGYAEKIYGKKGDRFISHEQGAAPCHERDESFDRIILIMSYSSRRQFA